MTKYIVRRLVGAIPLVIGIATIVFFAVNLAPGDPTARFISPGMTREVVEQMRTNTSWLLITQKYKSVFLFYEITS